MNSTTAENWNLYQSSCERLCDLLEKISKLMPADIEHNENETHQQLDNMPPVTDETSVAVESSSNGIDRDLIRKLREHSVLGAEDLYKVVQLFGEKFKFMVVNQNDRIGQYENDVIRKREVAILRKNKFEYKCMLYDGNKKKIYLYGSTNDKENSRKNIEFMRNRYAVARKNIVEKIKSEEPNCPKYMDEPGNCDCNAVSALSFAILCLNKKNPVDFKPKKSDDNHGTTFIREKLVKCYNSEIDFNEFIEFP